MKQSMAGPFQLTRAGAKMGSEAVPPAKFWERAPGQGARRQSPCRLQLKAFELLCA